MCSVCNGIGYDSSTGQECDECFGDGQAGTNYRYKSKVKKFKEFNEGSINEISTDSKKNKIKENRREKVKNKYEDYDEKD